MKTLWHRQSGLIILLLLATQILPVYAISDKTEMIQLAPSLTDETTIYMGNLYSEVNGDTGELTIYTLGREAYLRIRPPEYPIVSKSITDMVKEIIYPTYNTRFYPIEGGFEFETIYKSKPKTNMLYLPMKSRGFEFNYQAPLNEEYGKGYTGNATHVYTVPVQEFGAKGELLPLAEPKLYAVRPIEVVGSYAVTVDDEKIMHIYRPWIVDAEGWKMYCDLTISGDGMYIEIPQTILDTGVYPLKLDPTFGYTTIGASTLYPSSLKKTGCLQPVLDGSGTATKISVYSRASSGTVDMRTGYYQNNAGVPTNLLSQSANVTIDTTWRWNNFTTSQAVVNGTSYWLTVQASAAWQLRYDAGAANQEARANDEMGDGFDATFNADGVVDYAAREDSIFATYTASGPSYTSQKLIIYQNEIRYLNNTQMILVGPNFNWFNNYKCGRWEGTNMNTYGAYNRTKMQQTIDRIKAQGANSIRLIDNMEWIKFNSENHTGVLLDILNYCDSKEIYVIHCMYNVNQTLYGGSSEIVPCPPYADAPGVENVIANVTELVEFYNTTLAPFAAYPNYIYELYNEPHGNNTVRDFWKTTAQACIDGIRAAGLDNLIVMQWDYGTYQNLEFPGTGKTIGDWWDYMRWNDTESKLVASTHMYRKFDARALGQLNNDMVDYWGDISAFVLEHINNTMTFCDIWNDTYPVYVGELGIYTSYTTERDQFKEKAALTELYRLFADYNISVAAWWYRPDGNYRMLTNETTYTLNTYAEIHQNYWLGTWDNYGPHVVNFTYTGATTAAQNITLDAQLFDRDLIDFSWIYTNRSGAWQNEHYQNETGTQTNRTYTRIFLLPNANRTIGLRLYANDTVGASYNGSLMVFTVTGATGPPTPPSSTGGGGSALLPMIVAVLMFAVGMVGGRRR